MFSYSTFKKLYIEGLISHQSFEKIQAAIKDRLFSLEWELKTILYLGVLLLSGGLGILVYKNIDTIGHQAILAFIALISASCFYYCTRFKLPFSWGKVAAYNVLSDYVLLLGCLTFISFVAYLQYQYNVFGNRYGLATFIPMVGLFFVAYYYDHIGILSMAITSFAAWMGLSITPLHLLDSNDFNESRIIYTGIGIGIVLLVTAWATANRKWKAHFEFTYTNFGTHTLFVSLLAAMFSFEHIGWIFWFVILAAFTWYMYQKAYSERSFYFIMISTLYAYIAVSYIVIRVLDVINLEIASIYLGLIYFIVSAIWSLSFLMKTNKKLKTL
ncbi:MAG: DUF2157 domain-containing protein [Bacteroidota bacterium]